MILLAGLKFCWHILNFADAVFEVKVVPAKDPHQQNSAGVRQTRPSLFRILALTSLASLLPAGIQRAWLPPSCCIAFAIDTVISLLWLTLLFCFLINLAASVLWLTRHISLTIDLTYHIRNWIQHVRSSTLPQPIAFVIDFKIKFGTCAHPRHLNQLRLWSTLALALIHVTSTNCICNWLWHVLSSTSPLPIAFVINFGTSSSTLPWPLAFQSNLGTCPCSILWCLHHHMLHYCLLVYNCLAASKCPVCLCHWAFFVTLFLLCDCHSNVPGWPLSPWTYTWMYSVVVIDQSQLTPPTILGLNRITVVVARLQPLFLALFEVHKYANLCSLTTLDKWKCAQALCLKFFIDKPFNKACCINELSRGSL